MENKRESLRNGEIVELKPGVHGRLNKENRTLELDSGKVLPISAKDQRDFFPENEKALDVARRTEKLEKTIKDYPIGGEFLFQMGQSSGIGGLKDTVNYFTRSGEDYLKNRQAEQRVSSRISEESPITSGAATVASFLPDIYLTKGLSATKASPLITAASSGSRLFTEPGQVAEEALLSAGAGKLIDIGGKGLSNIAKRRAESRQMLTRQAAVKAENLAGQEVAEEANLLNREKYNRELAQTENENAARLHQRNLELRDAAKVENEWKSAVEAAKNEEKLGTQRFKSEQEAYKENLRKLPLLQREAQTAYSQEVVENAKKIADSFPKGSKIYSNSFGTNNFIEENINKSGLAGTQEANKAKKILNSIFREGEILSGEDLVNRYKALESAIQKSSPELKIVLSEFKENLGSKLTSILADNMAYNKVVGINQGREIANSLKNQIEKETEKIVRGMKLGEGLGGEKYVLNRSKASLNDTFRNLSSQDFIKKWKNGEIRQQLLNGVVRPDDFTIGVGNRNITKGGRSTFLQGLPQERIIDPAMIKYNEFVNHFSPQLDKILNKVESNIYGIEQNAARRIKGKIQPTLGLSPQVPNPQPPLPPQAINLPVMPANVPQNVPNAVLSPKPPLTINEPFKPQPEPNLMPPQGLAERAGDFFEKDLLKGGKGLVNNPLTKLAGLKYLLGKSALPIEAAYFGMKGLTSPTAAGEVARMTFKQGGIRAIDSWARKYPSYHDGVLESPQDRRALTKEIEDAQDITLEQKAILQSKVNRGKPISQKL
ncbi:Uncharacterised protein [uncultured archaeon]|nr:Uncharacterised protein [uncultured archaeon]